jgi:hypothetical protein
MSLDFNIQGFQGFRFPMFWRNNREALEYLETRVKKLKKTFC